MLEKTKHSNFLSAETAGDSSYPPSTEKGSVTYLFDLFGPKKTKPLFKNRLQGSEPLGWHERVFETIFSAKIALDPLFGGIPPLMSARRGATDFLLEKTKPSNFLSAETARDSSYLERIPAFH